MEDVVTSKKTKEKDLKDIFESSQKNKLLEKELELFTDFHIPEMDDLLNREKNENFMFKYFPSMFKNKKNFYVHIKKKRERRKNEKIYAIDLTSSANMLIKPKHSFLSKIESNPETIDLRLDYKKIWDSSVLEDEKSKLKFLKIN